MPLTVYSGGAWKQLAAAFVNVGGVWKRVQSIQARNASAWREVWRDTFYMVISSNMDDGLTVRDAALAAGWNGTSKVVVTINSGVRISRNATDCLRVQGSFPRGVELHNYGLIIGRGGAGGNGGGSHGGAEAGSWGQNGMTALLATTPVTVFNYGIIAGGGGGGGGGSGAYSQNAATRAKGAGGGGGGGRSNAHHVPGGWGGSTSGTGIDFLGGTAGGGAWGTDSYPGGGGGGSQGQYESSFRARGGNGGGGGGWGQGGSWGGGSSYYGGSWHQYPEGGGGGGAGYAVYGNQYITWGATGDRYGPLVNAT